MIYKIVVTDIRGMYAVMDTRANKRVYGPAKYKECQRWISRR